MAGDNSCSQPRAIAGRLFFALLLFLSSVLITVVGCARVKPPYVLPTVPSAAQIEGPVDLQPAGEGDSDPYPAPTEEIVTPTPTEGAVATPTTDLVTTPTATGVVTLPATPTETATSAMTDVATATATPTGMSTPTVTATAIVSPTAIVYPTAAPAQEITHVVAWGDTLIGLARRYGTTVSKIMLRNGLSSANYIYAGQRLVIPLGDGPVAPPAPQTVVHVVRYGDTLSKLSRIYRTSPSAILSQNPSITNPNILVLGTSLTITTGVGPVPLVHQVRYGENLTLIARRYGQSVQALVMANGLSNPNHVYVGQLLVIPR